MQDETIFKEAEYRKALYYLMNWCARAERSIVDVQKKLNKMQLPDDLSNQLVQQLQDEGYLNNQRFIDAYIHDAFHYNKWGIQKIKQALYAKGITGKMVDEAFARLIDKEEQIQLLEKELMKKMKSLGAIPEFQKKAKLLRFAASRGYQMDLVYSCLNRIIPNSSSEDVELSFNDE